MSWRPRHPGWAAAEDWGGMSWRPRRPGRAAAEDWGGGDGDTLAPLTPADAQRLQQHPALANRMLRLQNAVDWHSRQLRETQQRLREQDDLVRQLQASNARWENQVRELEASNARLEGVVDHGGEKMMETLRIIAATQLEHQDAKPSIRQLIREGLEEYFGGTWPRAAAATAAAGSAGGAATADAGSSTGPGPGAAALAAATAASTASAADLDAIALAKYGHVDGDDPDDDFPDMVQAKVESLYGHEVLDGDDPDMVQAKVESLKMYHQNNEN